VRAKLSNLAVVVPWLGGCGRLDQLIYAPPTTPQQWCEQRPCISVGGTILDEPLGTALVLLLAGLWLTAGVWFLKSQRNQSSRFWLGIALVLGGIGAALAGISYQAFGYVLKCAGRDLCVLTDGFEVGYSVAQALSVSAMLIAVSYACAATGLRGRLIGYAVLNAVLYGAISVAGVLMPSAILLSYVVLMLFALPGILIVIVISACRYLRHHDAMDRSLVVGTMLLIVVQAAYFAYRSAGLTATLWDDGRGFYFSENDVLHVGMMLWLAYVVFVIGKHLRDEPAVTVWQPAGR
jgi:hypothetical protein